MNKNLETRLRSKVRKLVERIITEETPMNPMFDTDDVSKSGGLNKGSFKSNPIKVSKPVKIGKMTVSVEHSFVFIRRGTSNLQMSMEDAGKLAEYLYRIAGKDF